MINSLNATLTCLLLMMAWVSCSGDDDDDAPPGDDFDVMEDNDDDTDDDGVADDEADDDADDADDDDGSPPVLSNGYWDPNPITNTQSSKLTFSVCDVDDDLSGGQVLISPDGDGNGEWLSDIFWDDFTGGAPHAPDCDAPATVGITVDFTAAPAATYSVDIEVTDGKGHRSNMLEDVTAEVIEN